MVVGFFVFTGLAVYFIISLLLIALGVSVARERGKPGWKGGLIVAVVMYMILFWDLIPMRVTHKYLCLTQGGFNVHKTLDEWKRENPGVAESLEPTTSTDLTVDGARQRYVLNQRFSWDIHTSKHLMGIRKRDERIVDLKTSEILAQYIDFDTDISSLGSEPRNFRDFKFWLSVNSCERTGHKANQKSFYEFEAAFENLGVSR